MKINKDVIIRELYKLCSGANKNILSLLDSNELCLSEIKNSDMLAISEIKSGRDGISIKFVDRIDGYIKLYELIEQSDNTADPMNFIEALSKSAENKTCKKEE